MAPDDGEDRVLGAIERLDDRLRLLQDHMNARFDALADRFMPRVEQMQRFEELGRQVTRNEADIRLGEQKHSAAEERRAVERRFTVTTLITSAGLSISLLVVVLAHWK